MAEYYRYVGPVRNSYGEIRKGKWEETTTAPSEAKALSNLRYRYSVMHKCSVGDVKLNAKYLTVVRESVW